MESYVGVPIRINNLGFRGPDTTLVKPPGVFRIIGVGDSITFGYGVRYDNTFLHVLEANLNAQEKPGRHYEVINAGVAATGLEYYTHFIENTAPSLEPDLIVVCMALNDIDPDIDPEPKEPRSQIGVFRSVNGYFLTHSYLYNTSYSGAKSLLFKLNILKLKDNEGFGFLALDPPSPPQDKAREGVKRYLTRIAAFTRSHHQRLGIVVFPLEPQLSERALALYARKLHLELSPDVMKGQPQGWVEQIGVEINVPVLDLLPAMRRGDDGELFLRNRSISVDPTHPSARGHRLVGEEMARWLENAGQL
ncbi:MAG: GDSL-type esterase/lipase family protein [Bryobacteraceae bacterium]